MAFDAEDGAPTGMERTRGKITRQYRYPATFYQSFMPVREVSTFADFTTDIMTRARRKKAVSYSYYTPPISQFHSALVPTHEWSTTEFSESDNDWS